MITLILVRHGQSAWNLENRFTGWVDVDITEQGEEEARKTGVFLKDQGYSIDKCYVSPLLRAQRTAALIKEASEQSFTCVEAPEIIERFYGGLTGLNKAETAQEYGDEQVHIWRRSYDVPPPPLEESDERHPGNNPAYKGFPFKLPATESLKDVVERVVPFYDNILKPAMKPGSTILLVAHGNSIRALIKHIKQLDNDEIQKVEIPTGQPLVVQFDDKGALQKDRLLKVS